MYNVKGIFTNPEKFAIVSYYQFSKSEESFLNGEQNSTNNRTALSNLVEIIAFKSGRINKSTIDYIITQMQIYLNCEE